MRIGHFKREHLRLGIRELLYIVVQDVTSWNYVNEDDSILNLATIINYEPGKINLSNCTA